MFSFYWHFIPLYMCRPFLDFIIWYSILWSKWI